jgi:hypothetical protein
VGGGAGDSGVRLAHFFGVRRARGVGGNHDGRGFRAAFRHQVQVPIWSITDLDTGMRQFSLPPVPPRYHPGGRGGFGGDGGVKCYAAYPTVCIPPPPPDLDRSQILYRDFKVLALDPHGFDGDHDGIGCEIGRLWRMRRANERDPKGILTVAWGTISPCRAGWCRPAE